MSTESVLYKVRRILNDWGVQFSDRVGGDDHTRVFELSQSPIEPSTVEVVIVAADGPSDTGIGLVNGTDFTVDPRNGVLTLTAPLLSTQVLLVSAIAYEDFTDEDLLDYIGTALAQHTVGRDGPVALDPVPHAVPPTDVLQEIEERPVALLAAALAYEDLATGVAKDITIDTGDGTVIPRSQRYQQLLGEAQRLKGEYTDLVHRLGLPGFESITVMSLRRVSPTTNRLVPIYKAREWDDRRWPQRVLPVISAPASPVDRVIRYRGTWMADQVYNSNDLVDKGGTRYLCMVDGTTVDPALDVAASPADSHGNHLQGERWQVSYINSGAFGYASGAW